MFDPKLKEALGRVQKPGRYTGGEPGSVYKDKEKVDVRFAFCFPDTYEVGMSFLGEKILYELLNSHENWWCERAFMPWLDMKAEMERLDLPLYTMESKDPLTDFDAISQNVYRRRHIPHDELHGHGGLLRRLVWLWQ